MAGIRTSLRRTKFGARIEIPGVRKSRGVGRILRGWRLCIYRVNRRIPGTNLRRYGRVSDRG